jgi:hypothetical protein
LAWRAAAPVPDQASHAASARIAAWNGMLVSSSLRSSRWRLRSVSATRSRMSWPGPALTTTSTMRTG